MKKGQFHFEDWFPKKNPKTGRWEWQFGVAFPVIINDDEEFAIIVHFLFWTFAYSRQRK